MFMKTYNMIRLNPASMLVEVLLRILLNLVFLVMFSSSSYYLHLLGVHLLLDMRKKLL